MLMLKRPSEPWVRGKLPPPPDFGKYVKPNPIRGRRPNTTRPPGFSDLPMVLLRVGWGCSNFHRMQLVLQNLKFSHILFRSELNEISFWITETLK